jgi:hypothetical protein
MGAPPNMPLLLVGFPRTITQRRQCPSIRAQRCSEADTVDTDEARFQWY